MFKDTMFIFQWINKQKEETDKISFKPIHRRERWSIDRFFFSLFVCKNQSRTMIFFWQRGRGALFRNNCTEWFIDTRWKTRQRKSVGIYHSDLMLFSFRPTWFRCIFRNDPSSAMNILLGKRSDNGSRALYRFYLRDHDGWEEVANACQEWIETRQST